MKLVCNIGLILSSLKSPVNCLNTKDKIFAPMDDDHPCLQSPLYFSCGRMCTISPGHVNPQLPLLHIMRNECEFGGQAHSLYHPPVQRKGVPSIYPAVVIRGWQTACHFLLFAHQTPPLDTQREHKEPDTRCKKPDTWCKELDTRFKEPVIRCMEPDTRCKRSLTPGVRSPAPSERSWTPTRGTRHLVTGAEYPVQGARHLAQGARHLVQGAEHPEQGTRHQGQ